MEKVVHEGLALAYHALGRNADAARAATRDPNPSKVKWRPNYRRRGGWGGGMGGGMF